MTPPLLYWNLVGVQLAVVLLVLVVRYKADADGRWWHARAAPVGPQKQNE